MIKFNAMLLTQQNILTFKLYKQLKELIQIAYKTKKIEN